MKLKIAISSGKGGTGKTFLSTNIAKVLDKSGYRVRYLDCDVEEPNGHLFLKPDIHSRKTVTIFSPVGIDDEKCSVCGKCAKACHYNAIAIIKNKVLFFQNLCHTCGACTIVCPEKAIVEEEREIGEILQGKSGNIDFHYALLKTAEGGMSPRLIKKLKKLTGEGINILDSPPGTACSAVETIVNTDLTVLVTDPTPFGINDLKLSVDMCREMGQEPVVVVNRADYMNEDLKIYCHDQQLEIIGEIPDDRKIAECYSEGGLVVERLPAYLPVFEEIAKKVIKRAREKIPVKRKPSLPIDYQQSVESESHVKKSRTKELVVLSGKGGTGKTSLAACFSALEKNIAIADCDVDAADLHLILQPEIKERGLFSGGDTARIDPEKCTGCGDCFKQCRFDAIRKTLYNDQDVYAIDGFNCEGCGVCCLVCPVDATTCEPAVNGEWYLSSTRFGPFSHAKLGVAEENSGKLVTLVKNKKDVVAEESNLKEAIIDGSPGTGCPVIASLTGADYTLIVTEPTVSGIHDLKRILDVAAFFRIKSGIVVNKYDLNPEKTEEIKKIAQETGSSFLGTIPYDRKVTQAQVKGLSVVEYTKAEISEIIKKIWGKVRDQCF